MLLDTLALKHDKWQRYATKICKDKYIADDVVSDMYLKMHRFEKEVSDSYIYLVLRSCFLDLIKKEKNRRQVSFEEVADIPIEEVDLREIPKNLSPFEMQILMMRADFKMKDVVEASGLSRSTIYRIEFKAKNKIK